jgi:FkbM family methyltransferase
MAKIKALLDTLRFVTSHPLNRKRPIQALVAWAKWQLGSRLVPGAVAVNFVNDVQILVAPGMTGATGNVYAGLHEFQDMSFVLHCLRAGDLFVDVGANVGSYTLLAGGGAGANCLAVEPILSTFRQLAKNIALNDLKETVSLFNVAVGHEEGKIRFTLGLDTENHVADELEAKLRDTLEVDLTTLDTIVAGRKPRVIKIDVEGFETNVISGGHRTLSDTSLCAVLIELNGLGMRYGFDEERIHQKMLGYGFCPFVYAPLERSLSRAPGKNRSGNTLYVKNLDFVSDRLLGSPPYRVLNQLV